MAKVISKSSNIGGAGSSSKSGGYNQGLQFAATSGGGNQGVQNTGKDVRGGSAGKGCYNQGATK